MCEEWLYCKSTYKIQRSSCPFMSGQVLLRGDLASQWPSPFQSCRALLYLQIRRCLAKPLYCLAFYLKVKADLAPVTLSLSVGLSVHLSVTVSYVRSRIRRCVCLSLPPLSGSSVCLYLSSLVSLLISCILHPVLGTSHSLSLSLSPHML